MSQYQTGTATFFSGEQRVSGEGTAWLANASVGDLVKRRGENAFYTVGAVTTDTTMDLTANYVGGSVSGELYTICRDFTDNYDAPEIWPGDKDWAYHLTYGLRIFDNEIKALEDAATGTNTVEEHGTTSRISLDSDDYNKIHRFEPESGIPMIVNLPPADEDDIGKYLDMRKRGSGELYFHRSGEGTIFGETRCLNETEETFAQVVLVLETATEFGAGPILGNWNFTSTGEAL